MMTIFNQSSENKQRINGLDGLRGISILGVLLSHSAICAYPHELPNNFYLYQFVRVLFSCGSLGVTLFFVISGFLIHHLLIREYQKTGTISISAFFLRRSLRILPAYLIFLLAVFSLYLLHYVEMSHWDWISVVTYTVNFRPGLPWDVAHLWSLSIEEQYYLVWPWLPFVFGIRGSFIINVVTLLCLPILRWTSNHFEWGLAETAAPMSFDAILFGCLLAHFVTTNSIPRFLQSLYRWRRWLIGLAIVCTFSISRLAYLTGEFKCLVPTICAIFLTYIVFVVQANSHQKKTGFLNNRFLIRLGVISYGVYLWQQLFTNPVQQTWWNGFPVGIILAILASMLSYVFIEKPFLRLKEHFQKTTSLSLSGIKPTSLSANCSSPGSATT